jgi:class 3 adenylate cyclase
MYSEEPALEAPPLERKLTAILSADVESYSRLMHRDEDATLVTLSSHRAIMDDLIAQYRGRVAGTAGDSVLAEFASVTDAFSCAIAIQQELYRANAAISEDRKMQFRIGINVGDVIIKDGDLFGDGVNVAARVQAAAGPGEICVTRGVRDHLRDRVDSEFVDLGEHAVKNIARPVRIFKVLFDRTASPDPSQGLVSEGAEEPVSSRTSTSNTEPGPGEIAFWEAVENSNTDSEYRAYLERYPDGAFASLARSRLEKQSENEVRNPEGKLEIELTFWNSIKDSDNPEMFNAYLEKFPDGQFRSVAEIRLTELRNQDK